MKKKHLDCNHWIAHLIVGILGLCSNNAPAEDSESQSEEQCMKVAATPVPHAEAEFY